MKILYFDCFAGISGDMVLGALIDAGLSLEYLREELGKLKLSGYSLNAERVTKNSLAGTKVRVEVTEKHTHRGLSDIKTIIEQSPLAEVIKQKSVTAFTRLAEVEAGVHNQQIDEIHFHEVGAVDAIVDIVGAMIGLDKLGIEAVYASKVHVGTGFVQAAHGTLPLPAPATTALLKNAAVYSQGIEAELTTPTGAAIITTLTNEFGILPEMTIDKIGYGAGERDLPLPNLLRVIIGTTTEVTAQADTVTLLETNIDNMNPEHFEYVAELLWERGVLDVYFTPIIMKKSRPATILSVLVKPDESEKIAALLFSETTTLGIRVQQMQRYKLARESLLVATKYGEVQVKVARQGDTIKNIAPEYEACRKIAAEFGLPLKDVYDLVKRAAEDVHKPNSPLTP